MKKVYHHLYFIIFLISRLFSISVFGICLFIVLHAKYVFTEKLSYFPIFFIDKLVNIINNSTNFIFDIGIKISTLPDLYYFFSAFCKNSQNIDLLTIALILVVIISLLSFKLFNKKQWFVYIITFAVYMGMYVISGLPIMLVLSVVAPLVLITIQIINKVCPIQKIIMLIPIAGEICCTKGIIKYIFKNNSDKLINIGVLIIALILSNVMCFLFKYKTSRDFENLIMNDYTYSVRPYKDKLIISGDKELISIKNNGNYEYSKNNKFGRLEDFIINENRNEIYIYNSEDLKMLILDAETLNIKKEIFDKDIQFQETGGNSRICCNDDFSKMFIVFECSNPSLLIDLNTDEVSPINNVLLSRDGLIYNKYRNSFLVSFVRAMPGRKHIDVLQEINIENNDTNYIQADRFQGYIAVSNKNKEIYVVFYQQGRIWVYDAETMKLKRKVKCDYTVKDITYDEELNLLIAPSYFTGYVDIFLMDGSDKLITRECVGYELREGCFDPQKENLYVCSTKGLYKKKINIRELIEENSKKGYR